VKSEDVEGQLRSLWRQVAEFFPEEVRPQWDSAEQAYIFSNGSWVYMRSLKASDEDSRYSKFRRPDAGRGVGRTVGRSPARCLRRAQGRLSQRDTETDHPHANSVDEDDWIAEEFPDDGDRPGHRYIRADLWSNRANLDEDTIAGFEQDFPIGHPTRLTMLEGKRGPNAIGVPVYDGVFKDEHISDELTPGLYPRDHRGVGLRTLAPAVVWAQHITESDDLVVLGAAQGRDLFLEQFTPEILKLRELWFSERLDRELLRSERRGVVLTW
jgi:hypothetical protein